MEEKWVVISEFDNYEISNYGEIRNLSSKKHLTLRTDRGRYHFVDLFKNGVRSRIYVQKLVADAFVPNENNYKYVKHIDNNTLNNKADNLEFSKIRIKELEYNNEDLSLLKKYNVRQQKDLPLYKKYKCRYNVMNRFCKEHDGVTTVWNTFTKFYSDLYPIYGDKFNDDVNYRMYLPWNETEYNLNTIAFGNKLDVNQNSIATKRYTINGVSKTLKEWAKEANIKESSLRDRLLGYQDILSFEDIVFSIGSNNKRYSKNMTSTKEATLDNKKARRRAAKIVSGYKLRDAQKGLGKNDLDMEWYIENILSKPCVYCGDTINIGCDRIDNNQAHNRNNVVPCCRECNIARGNNFTHDEFLHIGKAIKEVKLRRKQLL